MMDSEFDVIATAEVALEDGAGYREVIRRFAIHAVRAGRLGEFENLLASYDQDSGRLVLLEQVVVILDGGYVLMPRELCPKCRAKAAA